MTRLYVLDCGSLASWCFFADPDDARGMIKNLDAWLYDWKHRLSPTHAVACHDAGNSWRKVAEPEYKLGRKPKPEHMIAQFREVPALMESHGIASWRVDTMEADDCIASVASQLASEECEVIVVSEDKDLMALVGDNVRHYAPKAGVFRGAAECEEKFGVPIHRIQDLLAMWGDSADNIPGIKGIGQKKAVEAIRQTGSMKELWRRAREGTLANLNKGTQAIIAAGEPQYLASLALVKMRVDLPVQPIDTYKIRGVTT